MVMDKHGVSSEVLHAELRQEEARLMREMQSMMTDSTKTASDRNSLEAKLQQVRQKVTELDTQNSQET